MTARIDEIRARVDAIRSLTHDPEVAHSLEDDLYRDVLADIADGAAHPAVLATEALVAARVDFPRWAA